MPSPLKLPRAGTNAPWLPGARSKSTSATPRIGVWMALQFTLTAHGKPFDSNTFGLLNTVSQLCSLILVIGILVADETQAEIDQERSRLILQMLIIQDRKTSEALQSLGQLVRVQGLQPREGTRKVEDATDLHEAAGALREAEQQQGRTS